MYKTIFTVFTAVFVVSRTVIFPFTIILPIIRGKIVNINYSETDLVVVPVLFLMLLALQIVWAVLIVRKDLRLLLKG